MYKQYFLISFLFITISLSAQEGSLDSTAVSATTPNQISKEVPPLPPGCEGETELELQKYCLMNFVQNHVMRKYNTALVKQNKIRGKTKIVLKFVITKEGTIENVEAEGDYDILKEEGIRVIKLLPSMLPGKIDGQPVDVPINLPVTMGG